MKDGGPAFPCEVYDFQPHSGEQVVRESYGGMTLRDYFAAKAMHAIIAHPETARAEGPEDNMDVARGIARMSYLMADVMLAERGKK